VLSLAGFAQAASITVVDLGNPDTTVIGGGVHAELQKYQFVIAKTTETAKLNAIEIEVISSDGEIHQIWGETSLFGSNTFTASPDEGNITSPPQNLADSYFDPLGTNKWALTVIAHSEDMTGVGNGGAVGTNTYTGPTSLVDADVSGFGFQAGFGSTFHFVGAVPGGSEQDQYTVYQLVIPDSLTGTVTVIIDTTSPGAEIAVQEFVFGGAAPPVPVPAAYPLGLAGLGLLAYLRRRRHA
jgi:hypothetical protein